ncbi:MAG: cytochrome c3 family protein [Planctomycetota bacterium]|jgi:cytochrome b subunit of formate dehydrogenase
MVRVAGALLLLVAFVQAQEESCLKCHTDKAELKKARTKKDIPIERLLLDVKLFKRSVHATQACSDCHFDYDEHPHGTDTETAKCAECHEKQAKSHGDSVHGKAQEGKELPISCTDCHGVHDVYKPSERDSRLHPLNIHMTCGKCHFDGDPSKMTKAQLAEQKHMGDVHGRAILNSGLIVTATCVSCHTGHEARAAGDPESPLAPARVANTCIKCHVTAVEDYRRSSHRLKPRDPEKEGAGCTDCHAPHRLERAGSTEARRSSVDACGKCHEERLGTFHKSMHGKISQLGFGERAATCADCHANHAILPSSDPHSSMHPLNRVETCGVCHKKAHEEFTAFLVHADPTDADANPHLNLLLRAMTALLIGTFTFMGLHALLWLVRSLSAKEWRYAHQGKKGTWVRRWSDFYTALHVFMMLSFLGVGLSGLPLHFADKPWAKAVMGFLGGPQQAGFIHRVSATVMLATIGVYLLDLVRRLVIKREVSMFWGPHTMLPRYKDVQDFVGMIRWFLRLGPKPQFDRWTYWEKFDFWAVFWGVVVIGGSGLVLWFPEQATRIVPGWAINAAQVIHGHEALLAIGFIFSIHIFHTQFRPEKFPMDVFFFTGRQPEEEFKRERPLEYERAARAGLLEQMRDRTPGPRTMHFGYVIGIFSLIVGISFVVAMVAA